MDRARSGPEGIPSGEGQLAAWSLVVIQFALIGLLLVGSRGALWLVTPVVSGLGLALVALGLVIMAGAAWQIRRALTASPLPNQRTELMDRGWFARVRHPIYSGLLVTAAGLTATRASVLALACLVGLAVLLQVKARFEETVLARHFPDYGAYQARTGRLLPRLRPRG
jgi:protein-S-isoprenylcysteine O-methyltransferase Ste14